MFGKRSVLDHPGLNVRVHFRDSSMLAFMVEPRGGKTARPKEFEITGGRWHSVGFRAQRYDKHRLLIALTSRQGTNHNRQQHGKKIFGHESPGH
jgi:hypothetical protein